MATVELQIAKKYQGQRAKKYIFRINIWTLDVSSTIIVFELRAAVLGCHY